VGIFPYKVIQSVVIFQYEIFQSVGIFQYNMCETYFDEVQKLGERPPLDVGVVHSHDNVPH
jgi:hypothetical protein